MTFRADVIIVSPPLNREEPLPSPPSTLYITPRCHHTSQTPPP
ncbi:hypothetical protein HPB50_029022 [Hyalomma asiaticum]|nr:hypothetical protein HPB50_029022 [Hyalomma asiaticum]